MGAVRPTRLPPVRGALLRRGGRRQQPPAFRHFAPPGGEKKKKKKKKKAPGRGRSTPPFYPRSAGPRAGKERAAAPCVWPLGEKRLQGGGPPPPPATPGAWHLGRAKESAAHPGFFRGKALWKYSTELWRKGPSDPERQPEEEASPSDTLGESLSLSLWSSPRLENWVSEIVTVVPEMSSRGTERTAGWGARPRGAGLQFLGAAAPLVPQQ